MQVEENLKRSLTEFLRKMGENPERAGIVETPERFVNGLREMLNGYDREASFLFEAQFPAENYSDWVILENISFTSLCEHHLLPFSGTVSMAYFPQNGNVLGLSKLARLVEIYSRRLQLQERLTVQLAETLWRGIQPRAVAVKIQAEHSCMGMRGVRKCGMNAVTRHRLGSADSWPF